MMNRMDSGRLIGLLTGVALCFATSAAWSQIPGRSFRSSIPSRVVPAQNVVPAEESSDQPAPAARPELTPVERPLPGALKPLIIADENQPAAAEPLPAQSEPAEPKVAWRAARTNTTKPLRAGISSDGSTTSKLLPKTSAAGVESSAKTDEQSTGEGEATDDGVTTLVKGEVQQAWLKVLYVWRFPFLKTKDFDLSLQVIIGGLFLLWLGQKLARRLSTWLGETVLRRVGLPPATSAPLQKVSFYVLFGLFAVFSLQLVGVPMTVFTFFGGALAIGIGFGSQNVMNNFISGLILLIERPIRVGDVIQIDSHSGKVSEIGARSTRITTGSNLEVIIPNSTFLQGNVINWTLSDDMISSKVTVGVAYGSPAREVERLLKQAAQTHEQILKTPGPGVSFTEFSDHAMQFELSFWLKMSEADRGKVESDLRFKIDELFSDRGIVIAYPQRDVHLNLMRPVEVRLSEPFPAPRELRGAA
ncbi:MAG: mechanosensitive ion channel domain-containing protein [Pirellulaceae bacterium]